MSESGDVTISEARLWRSLEGRWPGWVREYATGPYRLDFYCPSARVAVEVDGSSHASYEAARHDMQRDGWHRERGITTLRFSTGDVMRRRWQVVGLINEAVTARVGKVSWRTRREFRGAVKRGQVYVGPPVERVVTAADLPLQVKDPRQAEAMRRYQQLGARRTNQR